MILGGSFGGLTAAYELRRRLPRRQLDITVVSKDARFYFIPSLPWVTMGHKTLDEISFPLAPSLKSKGIECIIGEAELVNPQSQTVTVSPTGQTTYANKTFSVTTCSKLTPFWEGLWMFTAIIGFGISAFGVFVIMTRNDR